MNLLREFMEMKIVDSLLTYLGLPVNVGGKKFTMCRWIEDKMQVKNSRVESDISLKCRQRSTNKGLPASIPDIRNVLLQIPKDHMQRLSAMNMNFGRVGSLKGQGIHLVRKIILQKHKEQGGMGFNCFEILSIALLMK